jgi:uncharacterized repeat protein (TIGR02543 family)
MYAGVPVEPTPEVSDGDPSIIAATDYEVSYVGNDAPGTATVTLTGRGNYTGTKSVTFEILPSSKKVVLDALGGTIGAAVVVTQECANVYGELPTATREGYAFAGWWTMPNGGTRISASTTVEADITLYAIWLRPNCYGIAFDPGVENTEWSMDCQSVELGKVAKLSRCTFTAPAGKRFAGWRRKDNGRRYDDGVMVFNLASEPGAVIVLEAVWEDLPR